LASGPNNRADERPAVRQRDSLTFYASHSQWTHPGRHAARLDKLPKDLPSLVRITQGLGIYDVVAAEFYGCRLGRARQNDIHLRTVAQRLDRVVALDRRPLSVGRSPNKRVAGRCHQFTLLLVAMLRSKGIPARARCGFGAYFNPPKFEDHWVCEYWNHDSDRWVLVDAQLDNVWRDRLHIAFDPLDVPRDQFVTAAVAWHRCRRGEVDPAGFGISFVDLYGLWFVAGSLIRDLAALNKVEMLPWDVWGAQPAPGAALDADQVALFDELAALTADSDAHLGPLRRRYAQDSRLRVPERVFNALRNRPEPV
jgi:Transglutaminase-like superfamily